MERAEPVGMRSDDETAGRVWPNVPPKPGVEVTETMLSVEELDVMRTAPKLFVSLKTEPRTSKEVEDFPGSRLSVCSGPFDPSWLLPRNFSVNEAAVVPVSAIETLVV